MNRPIQVWGHRGCRGAGHPPENSLESFQAAVDQGADGIEFDLFLSRDDQLVVFHDDTLERMTDGTGNVTARTVAELKRLRLKDSTGRPTESVIPTLDEVLDLVERFRQALPANDRARSFVANLEIKEMPGKNIAQSVAAAVTRRLQQGWSSENFQVSSFDFASLHLMKEAEPRIPLGALVHGGERPWDVTPSQLADRVAEIRELRPQTVNVTLPSLTNETAALIRRAGAEPLVWTCDEPHPQRMTRDQRASIARRLFDNRVRAVITDYPGPMLALLGEHFDGR